MQPAAGRDVVDLVLLLRSQRILDDRSSSLNDRLPLAQVRRIRIASIWRNGGRPPCTHAMPPEVATGNRRVRGGSEEVDRGAGYLVIGTLSRPSATHRHILLTNANASAASFSGTRF